MYVRDVVKYLSPSSLVCWEYNPTDWYKRYVLKEKFVPNVAMDCGTLFDHYCKTALGYNEVREIDHKHEGMVRPVFEAYRPHLMDFIKDKGLLILESTITGEFGCPLLGKPDLYCDFVRDWKTSGWTAKTPPSPKPGYYWDSKTGMGHKAYSCNDGFTIFGEGEEPPWGVQMTTYMLLLKLEVADIHWKSPTRCAKYRYKLDKTYADNLIVRYNKLWNADLSLIEMCI